MMNKMFNWSNENQIRLSDFIDFTSVTNSLQENLPNQSAEKLERSFRRFYFADERSEFWYYTPQQCEEVIQEMKEQFVEDMLGRKISFAAKTARECGLELIGEDAFIKIRKIEW